MNKTIDVPILVIGFNRPEVIRETFSFVRAAKPTKLYIAIDGAREYVAGEIDLVEQVKNVFSDINWKCEVYRKFNNINRGAEITVSSAVNWVFEKEEFVIVLEDDIIAPLSFLLFAQEMLYKYKDVENIYQISGLQITPPPIEVVGNDDYVFAMRGHTGGGWATWRRAWDKFTLYVDDFDCFLQSSKLDEMFLTKKEIHFSKSAIRKMKRKERGGNSWDKCWSYIRLREYGLSIIPKVNLTSNIGIYGLHANGKTNIHNMLYQNTFVVKNHPAVISHNKKYDKYHFENYLYHSLAEKVIYRINGIIKKYKG